MRGVPGRSVRQSAARLAGVAFLMLWAGTCDARPLSVFVSIPPQKFLVARLGGARVNVGVFLDPGQAPETFEPSPSRLVALAGARLFFRIGVPFEVSALRSLASQNPDMTVVDCSKGLVLSGQDPHIWMSPRRMRAVAQTMRDALMHADPGGAAIYAANFRRLAGDLDAVDRDLKNMLRDPRTPYFIIAHAALGYLARDYGLVQLALESEGREAGPRELAQIADIARRARIHTILVQKQFNPAPARALAGELGAELVEIDPLSADYLANLRQVGRKLARAVH